MAGSVSNQPGITLASLPPDVIRIIISVAEDPFATGIRLVSPTWNGLVSEYRNTRCRPVDLVVIDIYGHNPLTMEVVLFETDLDHFDFGRWIRIPSNSPENTNASFHMIRVRSPPDLYNRKTRNSIGGQLGEFERQALVLEGMKRLARLSSRIGALRLLVSKPTDFYDFDWVLFKIVNDRLGSARIEKLELMCSSRLRNRRLKDEMESMVERHKVANVYINGAPVTL